MFIAAFYGSGAGTEPLVVKSRNRNRKKFTIPQLFNNSFYCQFISKVFDHSLSAILAFKFLHPVHTIGLLVLILQALVGPLTYSDIIVTFCSDFHVFRAM